MNEIIKQSAHRDFVLDCPGCPSGLLPSEQVEWALTQPYAMPGMEPHPLQKAAVVYECSRESCVEIDEERLDLALAWILDAEHLRKASSLRPSLRIQMCVH